MRVGTRAALQSSVKPTTIGLFASLMGLAAACSAVDEGSTHEGEGQNESELVGSVSSALQPTDSVAQAVAEGSCSTASVRALSEQLVQEIQCMKPGQMKRIDDIPGVSLNQAGARWLQTPAANALAAAQKARNTTLRINSALRTLPDQYVLYRWFQQGKCGITAAAIPGRSNHESGIAVDVADSAGWRASLQGKSFKWLGPGDVPHYDFTGGGTVKLSGLSILAFQRLWNRNNPNDKIAEDGSYGDGTAQRLAKSPVGGFKVGAPMICPPPELAGDAGADAAPMPDMVDAGAPVDTNSAPDAPDQPQSTSGDEANPELPGPDDGCSLAPTHKPATAPLAALIASLAAAATFLRRRRR
jgi:hypothetical protein